MDNLSPGALVLISHYNYMELVKWKSRLSIVDQATNALRSRFAKLYLDIALCVLFFVRYMLHFFTCIIKLLFIFYYFTVCSIQKRFVNKPQCNDKVTVNITSRLISRLKCLSISENSARNKLSLSLSLIVHAKFIKNLKINSRMYISL